MSRPMTPELAKEVPIPSDFGERLKRIRIELCLDMHEAGGVLSQGTMYDGNNWDAMALQGWEQPNETHAAFYVLRELADGYGSTIEYLLGETEEMFRDTPNRRYDAVIATREKYK